MRKRQLTAFVVAAVLASASFTGCDLKTDTPVIGKFVGLEENQIFKVDELICSKPEYMLVLMNTQNQYRNDFGGTVDGGDIDWSIKIDDETTLQDFVMEKVKEDITVKYTLAALAQKKGITLSDIELTNISDMAEEYYTSLNEKEKEYTGAEEADVENIFKTYLLADKVYSSLTEHIGANVSDEEARVITIQYIRMNSDKTKANKIESTYQDVTDLVYGGYQQFSREAKQYSEDDVIEKILKKNEVTAVYEKEAFNLNNGEISNIIQDGKNYYLVYCVESYMENETAENKQSIISKMKQEEFNKQYDTFLKEAETDFNTGAWEDIELSDDAANVRNESLMEIYKKITE